MRISRNEAEPDLFTFEEVEDDDVHTLKGALSEEFYLETTEDSSPDFTGFEDIIMELDQNKKEEEFTLDSTALRGLAKVLNGFHKRTNEMVTALTQASDAYPHHIRIWYERRYLGNRAGVINSLIDEAYPPVIRELEESFEAPDANKAIAPGPHSGRTEHARGPSDIPAPYDQQNP